MKKAWIAAITLLAAGATAETKPEDVRELEAMAAATAAGSHEEKLQACLQAGSNRKAFIAECMHWAKNSVTYKKQQEAKASE